MRSRRSRHARAATLAFGGTRALGEDLRTEHVEQLAIAIEA